MKKYLIIFFVLLMTGCSSSGNKKPVSEYDTLGKWKLINLGGMQVTDSDFTSGAPWMDIKVDAMAFNGNAGCNKMSGTVVVTSKNIAFSHIVTTKMACEKGDETGFLAALEGCDTYSVENNNLYLYNGKIVTAVFKKIN